MKSQITIGMILGIILIASASATIAGTCESFTFQTNILNYTVSGNSSDTNGMNVSLSNNLITICFVPNYKIDSFTLTFYSDIIPIESTTYKSNFGGGGCLTNYTCSDWSVCSNNLQTRTCSKDAWKGIKDCYARPVSLSQNCTNEIIPEPPINQTVVPQEVKKENNLFKVLIVLLIIGAIIYAVFGNRKEIKSEKKEDERDKKIKERN
jgi:hypothetical protein